ncbi:hypothetical protein [Nocardia blacklockiae]|uniref:hypothetical protein n=1 Tax=Nocardia blacklockiae TaxID=480036 RepID=UPI00189332E1|nr:hypothetical protein [Nocardia blacklockiae]MBF6171044.1 hypothetical protein [Nocardia blacklockiae]
MTLFVGWQVLAEPAVGCPAVVAVLAWSRQLLACVREWLGHRTTRRILREAPGGSRVLAARRCRGGSVSVLVVEVAARDAPNLAETGALTVGEKHT